MYVFFIIYPCIQLVCICNNWVTSNKHRQHYLAVSMETIEVVKRPVKLSVEVYTPCHL